MALFRCASGSSGGGATITVTYSSDFYGETVTCSHGTKTYSKVATSSGTLEFSVDEEGTWTISSMGFSDTADVVLNYPAELVSIPDGETVLPTDDIEKWLLCADIKDKSYTTLNEVLADSETYNALLGDSNACAYMKRSTTWSTDICASQYAMNLLGQYDTACDALLSDATWTTALNNSSYWYGHTDTGEKIHGANGESAYILDGGSPVTITDPSTLDAGTYTVYSTVAKNPSDLTADYSKTIRICPNTKEIVVRPDNSLYWWGYENSNLEDVTSANGWSQGSVTLDSPTHNQTTISIVASGGAHISGIGTKKMLSSISAIKCIAKATTLVSNTAGRFNSQSSKTNFVYSSGGTAMNSTSDTLYTIDATSLGNKYYIITTYTGRAIDVSAVFYE